MKSYLFTGISGCGRIELLEDLQEEMAKRGKTAMVLDVGKMIFEAAKEIKIIVSEKKIMDIDRHLLESLRRIAILRANNLIRQSTADIILIGVHATFRWRGRLINGVNFQDLKELPIDGILNIVDDVSTIVEVNRQNPKYEDVPIPDATEMNNWLMEEEFVSFLLSEILGIPVFLVGRNHTVNNLADLILVDKPKIYLSYPVTAIKEQHPHFLDDIKSQYLPQLEDRFIVFNPLVIQDLEKVGTMKDLSADLLASLNARTVVRDYRFIDQSDFIVVVYMTDKISPGVLSEVIYAGTHSKPVYMVYPDRVSPFLSEYTTVIFKTFAEMLEYLDSPDFKGKLAQSRLDFGLFASR